MLSGTSLVISLCICFLGGAQAAVPTVVKNISVTNGGGLGDWGEEQYCEPGTYAVGFDMKIEDKQGSGDDSALNGIRLLCKAACVNSDIPDNAINSSVGAWGNWVGSTSCDGQYNFLSAFRLQVEAAGGENFDDSAANSIEFKCRDGIGACQSSDLKKEPGVGVWGTFGNWSSECPCFSAICGIKTRLEKDQGSGDDTALNDVQFMCCE